MTARIETEERIRLVLVEMYHYSGNDIHLLIELVATLRPSKAGKVKEAEESLRILIYFLREEQHCQALKSYLLRIFSSRNAIRAFTELGILSSTGFYSETWRKVMNEILPPAYPDTGIMKVLHRVFHKRNDHIWVEWIPTQQWAKLFETLGYKEPHQLRPGHPALNQMLNCILVLSQRITAAGLEPEVVEKMPEIELFNSPYMVQSREISAYLENFNREGFERTTENSDYKHILVMLRQCEEYVKQIRKNKSKFGTSLRLTYVLLRIMQHIERLRTFLKLVHLTKEDFPFEDEATFFKLLIRAENKKHSLKEHFSQNLVYLAFQVTEHTGRTGEKYITATRKEYGKMLISALGGGLIVGFLVIIKAFFYKQVLSLLGRAFFFSMNYSIGFIIIHLTKSTLATKQPAMTASKVASALDISGTGKQHLGNLVELIVRLSRSQFVAFIGNILLAFPVAFGVAYLIALITGIPFIEETTVEGILLDIHPWKSLALFHAAIAGVYLSLSGLISGYYDNLNLYNKISHRVREHPFFNTIFSRKKVDRIADYTDKNLGALAGNFFLGIFLGTTGVFGYIIGVPIDIRHVTFASGNFGLALASTEEAIPIAVIAISLLGIFLIGFINFIVSFGLTILVVIESRKISFREGKLLLRLLMLRFFTTPFDFFWAPRSLTAELKTPEESNKPLRRIS